MTGYVARQADSGLIRRCRNHLPYRARQPLRAGCSHPCIALPYIYNVKELRQSSCLSRPDCRIRQRKLRPGTVSVQTSMRPRVTGEWCRRRRQVMNSSHMTARLWLMQTWLIAKPRVPQRPISTKNSLF